MRTGIPAILIGLMLGGGAIAADSKPEQKGGAKMSKTATATFAGGCFWCMQPPFDKTKGVLSTTVGYSGGTKENPTYEEVCSETTGHQEAVQVVYDPAVVTYEQLLDVFWRNIDPTDGEGQFVDRGDSYRAVIFAHDEQQKKSALAAKEALEKSKRFGKPIVTPVVPAATFWPGEDYHQKYYEKNPIRYKYYRFGSGRDAYLKKAWGADAAKVAK